MRLFAVCAGDIFLCQYNRILKSYDLLKYYLLAFASSYGPRVCRLLLQKVAYFLPQDLKYLHTELHCNRSSGLAVKTGQIERVTFVFIICMD